MITEAERRFPVRVMIAQPAGGFAQRLNELHAWLDANCGADGWAETPTGRGLPDEAVAVHFRDATLAAAFVARWCVVGPAEVENGLLKMREDTPAVRVPLKDCSGEQVGDVPAKSSQY